ncbi:uncharacterized protein QC761_0001440 [Podospora bellae-mahoneyi]|uniref:Uncharacterized protein n=1 Tax=Podospora bellae-mahoneyi TaxID=2093777 RepID=A0ABR0FU56_9PEZI|nr:hypothetical protein QC761_0001440 [Podospora bellae-mahoneyi]
MFTACLGSRDIDQETEGKNTVGILRRLRDDCKRVISAVEAQIYTSLLACVYPSDLQGNINWIAVESFKNPKASPHPLACHPRDVFHPNNTVLPRVALHPVKRVAKVLAPHVLQKLLVVGDDNQLQVPLRLPRLDDPVQAARQAADVVAVEVGRRLVQRDQAAVDAKRLGQC